MGVTILSLWVNSERHGELVTWGMPVGWFWEFSLILVGKSRRELTGTARAHELWEDSLYVEFVDKYKSNADYGDDGFHFHVYI